MNNNCPKNIPNTFDSWISEISEAYCDAYKAIPFGIFVLKRIKEKDLFQMTPQICIKFRGIENNKTNLNKATEAMLCSYVSTEENNKDIFINPYLSFAFGYLASHYGLGLLSEENVNIIMKYLEKHQIELKSKIETRCRKKSV
jgi:hypothetical protein